MSGAAARQFVLNRGVLACVQAWALEAATHECCGVLGGGANRIQTALRVRNESEHERRFALDPVDLIRALRQLDRAGCSLLGFFHSHVSGYVTPSRRDVAGSLWPELAPNLHLIVGAGGQWRLYRTSVDRWYPKVCLLSGSAREPVCR